MTISVIIATMNRPLDLSAALKSVAGQSRLPDEVWIIDQSVNQDSKNCVEQIRTEFPSIAPRIHYVLQEPKSLVKARNRGLEKAAGDILSFLDDDIILNPDYFKKIENAFKTDPDVVAVSGNAKVKEAWFGWRWKLRMGLQHLFLLNHYNGKMTLSGFGHPIYEREIDKVTQVEMLPGCNMNFRRAAVQGEKFDEFFKGYSYREDAEYSYRISKRGKVLMIPDAKLLHNYSMSSRLSEAELKKMKITNYHYTFEKFKGRNIFSRALFVYSLFGLAAIDLLEFMSNRSQDKWDKFIAGATTSLSLLKGRKNES